MDMTIPRVAILGLGVCAASSVARADTWLALEAPAAIPVSDVQAGVFRTGVMPAFGLYADRGVLAFGVRARAGVLRDGPAPSGSLEESRPGRTRHRWHRDARELPRRLGRGGRRRRFF